MTARHKLLGALAALAAMMVPLTASAAPPGGTTWTEPHLGAASGSAVGPGGALYVPQPAAGEIWRIDRSSRGRGRFGAAATAATAASAQRQTSRQEQA